jgi:hypothetical protein
MLVGVNICNVARAVILFLNRIRAIIRYFDQFLSGEKCLSRYSIMFIDDYQYMKLKDPDDRMVVYVYRMQT